MRKKTLSYVLSAALTTVAATPALADGSTSSWVNEDHYAAPSAYASPIRTEKGAGNTSRRYTARELARMRDLAPFAPNSNNVALEIGQIFLMGDPGSYSDALGGALKYNFGVSRMFGFDSAVGYSSHSQGKYSMLSLTGGVRMNLAYIDRLIPHLKLGMGFYHPSREITPGTNASATLFGLNGGAGLDLQISREMFFGTSLNLHNVFGSSKETPTGVVELGGSYLSFLASVGYTF